jgi:hypothetical protein
MNHLEENARIFRTASHVPLSKWPRGWLILEICGIINSPVYMLMTDDERRGRDLPVSDDEMRAFIALRRGIPIGVQ